MAVADEVFANEILGLGWKQGVCFQANGFAFLDAIERSKTHWQNDEKSGDLWVIASQTCDIIKTPSREPYVYALRAFMANELPPRNTYRLFAIDRGRKLVADAAYGVHLKKEALRYVPVLPGLEADPARAQWFSLWLANRFTRDAFPNEVVGAVIAPLKAVLLREARSKDPDVRAVLQRGDFRLTELAVAEFYSVEMLLVTDEPLDGQLKLAAGRIIDALRAALRPDIARLELCRIATSTEISLDYYLQTREIDLDDASFATLVER